jgi:CheY-like chemotaxis protein
MTRRPRTVSGTGSPGRERRVTLPTILLVDPSEDARAMVRDALLEGARPSVLRAVATAGELADHLSRELPSLVLVDLDLPDGGGMAAIHAAKSARPELPVVALTARPDEPRVAAAYAAGANTVLPRPVTFLALVRLMKVFTAYWLESAVLPPEAA